MACERTPLQLLALALTVTCFPTPSSRFLRDPHFINKHPGAPSLAFVQSHVRSPASIKASRQSAGSRLRLKARTTGGFSVADVTRGEEQAARMAPSGIKICEFMNLALLEGQPLSLCRQRLWCEHLFCLESPSECAGCRP